MNKEAVVISKYFGISVEQANAEFSRAKAAGFASLQSFLESEARKDGRDITDFLRDWSLQLFLLLGMSREDYARAIAKRYGIPYEVALMVVSDKIDRPDGPRTVEFFLWCLCGTDEARIQTWREGALARYNMLKTYDAQKARRDGNRSRQHSGERGPWPRPHERKDPEHGR